MEVNGKEQINSVPNEAPIIVKHNGTIIKFDNYDRELILAIRSLDPEIKVRVIHLTTKDICNVYRERTQFLNEQALRLLNQNWYWRETDELVNIEAAKEFFTDFRGTIRQLKNSIKKRLLSYEELDRIYVFFLGESGKTAEVYDKENRID